MTECKLIVGTDVSTSFEDTLDECITKCMQYISCNLDIYSTLVVREQVDFLILDMDNFPDEVFTIEPLISFLARIEDIRKSKRKFISIGYFVIELNQYGRTSQEMFELGTKIMDLISNSKYIDLEYMPISLYGKNKQGIWLNLFDDTYIYVKDLKNAYLFIKDNIHKYPNSKLYVANEDRHYLIRKVEGTSCCRKPKHIASFKAGFGGKYFIELVDEIEGVDMTNSLVDQLNLIKGINITEMGHIQDIIGNVIHL